MKMRRDGGRARLRSLAIEVMGGGSRIVLPRPGLSRAGHGMFWVGICFCIGIAIITAAFVIFPRLGSTEGGVYTPPSNESVPALVIIVLGAFWLVSLGTVLFGMNMGLRRGVVEVTGESLRIQQISPFSNRLVELPRGRITAVQRGATGLSIGSTRRAGRSGAAGKGVDELHIYTDDGARLRFFGGRETSELELVAAHLREALAVGTRRYDGT